LDRHLSFFLILALGNVLNICGQTAIITGVVFDHDNHPLADVNISSGEDGTFTDSDGFYLLEIIAEVPNTIEFSHLGLKSAVLKDLILTSNETYFFNPVLKVDTTQVDGVVVTATGERKVSGITTISPELARTIPGANAGVENVLKLLPGVSSNNELSTQYAVRGGNYDENLVYINDIEIYRPFLIRAGQQEGLGIVNSSMIQQLQFSAGGFQARYGDKLSSVLDITYKQPAFNGLDIEVSLLGGGITAETRSADKKFSTITGFRYRDNSLFVNSQQTQTNVRPIFADLQSYLSYSLPGNWQLSMLGAISLNRYINEPLTRQTNFGTINEPRALFVYYDGREKNSFSTAMGALKADYSPNEHLGLKWIASLQHSIEEEYSDIIAQYELGEVVQDPFGGSDREAAAPRGIGAEYNRRRNDLDALLLALEHKGRYTRNGNSLRWGVAFRHEDFRDQIRESEFLDSLGYFIRPPGTPGREIEPEEPFAEPLVPYEGTYARNYSNTNRLLAYLQYSRNTELKNLDLYYNIGFRWQHWEVSAEGLPSEAHMILSPRLQLAIKPHWQKDMFFRLAAGVYQQPPFYRELRDAGGMLHPEVLAQRSYHLVMGYEYSFNLWNRPFNLLSEAYYKYLDRVNPYTLEDVRIRYEAENNATAFARGVDVRLHGAFVPGLESWVSLGYLETKENINNKGYIPRPTDQHFKLGLLFQDYIPSIPQVRMYLNLVYQTGVPGGSPSYADPYNFQNRLRDYKRADLGISHIFADTYTRFPKNHWLHSFEELYAGIEIFNLFNNQNSITNTWVRDIDNKQQVAVPNYMTSRVLNIKLRMRF
jgi:hypothetical protein